MARKMKTAEAELYIKAFEDDIQRAKEKLLRLEFKVPGLSEEAKGALAAVTREILAEIAKERLPAKLRKRIPPELANRIDYPFKLWSPVEQ